MKKKELSLRNFDKNKENPFIETAIQDIKIIKKTEVVKPSDKGEIQMIINQSGEIEGYSQFLKFVEVEEERFTKIYLSHFASFWELPQSAIRVFGYIMAQLKPKQDKFEFMLEDCIQHTKYKSKTQIYEGLTALCENGIIARGYNEYIYFINPLVIFNGDRVTFAKTYIKKKKEKELNTQPIKQISESIISDFENDKKSI